jgi:hypothetical protein
VSGEPPITVVAALTPGGAAGGGASATDAEVSAAPRRVRGPGDNDDLIDFAKVSDVMSTLMAKGFVLGKDALAKAKAREAAPQPWRVFARGFETRALRCARRRWTSRRASAARSRTRLASSTRGALWPRVAHALALRRQLHARKPCRTRTLAPRAPRTAHRRVPYATRALSRTHALTRACADALLPAPACASASAPRPARLQSATRRAS